MLTDTQRQGHVDNAYWSTASREQRERVIADMPMQREDRGEHPVLSMLLWLAIALCAAMFLVALA